MTEDEILIVKAERTGKFEFTAWTETKGEFMVITKNSNSLHEMFEQIRKFWTRWSIETRLQVIYNDYTDENGNPKIPNE